MRFRLSDLDRERFGCPEWLDVDLNRVTNKEAATIQKVLGFDGTEDLAAAWNDQWKRDSPDAAPTKFAFDYDVWDAYVWIALRHAGVLPAVTRDEMHKELEGIEYEVVRIAVGADVDPGKETASGSTPETTSTD